jgi:hypothetical protein
MHKYGFQNTHMYSRSNSIVNIAANRKQMQTKGFNHNTLEYPVICCHQKLESKLLLYKKCTAVQTLTKKYKTEFIKLRYRIYSNGK